MERWSWDGTAIRDGQIERLAPGTYQLVGALGETFSEAVRVAIVE